MTCNSTPNYTLRPISQSIPEHEVVIVAWPRDYRPWYRILVVDDHDAMRRSLSWFLTREDDFAICGEAADGVRAVEQARYLAPDAIVMDVSMPKMDGLTAARIIHRENPSAHIVMIRLKEPSIFKEISSRFGLAFIDNANLSGELILALRHMTKYRA